MVASCAACSACTRSRRSWFNSAVAAARLDANWSRCCACCRHIGCSSIDAGSVIAGESGEELATPLGTVIHLQHAGVDYIVIGSVRAASAEAAARALTR